MKRGFALFIILITLAGVASAQVGFTGGVHGGLSISSFGKSVKDYYGVGFQFGAQGEASLMKFLAIRGSVDYKSFALDKDKLKSEIARDNSISPSTLTLEGLTVSIISINVSGVGKIPTAGPVTPYGIAGFGLNLLSQSDPKLTYNGQDVTNQVLSKAENQTKFGIHFGAGSEFNLGGAKLFAEIKYAIIFTKDENTGYIPITVGVNF